MDYVERYNFAKKNFDRKVLAQNYLIALNGQISKK